MCRALLRTTVSHASESGYYNISVIINSTVYKNQYAPCLAPRDCEPRLGVRVRDGPYKTMRANLRAICFCNRA